MKIIVSLAQLNVIPADPLKNIKHAEGFIKEASKRSSHIICLPELWTTGFDWDYLTSHHQEHRAYLEEAGKMAKRYKIWLYGSMPYFDKDNRLVNAGILLNPGGEIHSQYDKTHLFSLMGEDRYFAKGQGLIIADTNFARLGLSICYDLRFLEIFRIYALHGADIVLLTSAFPYPRLEHWKVLLRARAIENQIFLLAVNRVGREVMSGDRETEFFGNSKVIDPWGNVLVEASENKEELLTTEIDLAQIKEVRQKINVYNDRRTDLYELNYAFMDQN